MQQSQVVTYGIEGKLAERLRELAETHRLALRETSLLSACRNMVQSSPPSLLILRLGSHLERELALLEQVHACLPKTAVIVLGEADNPVLAGLVWELGATFALFPPAPMEQIVEVILRLLPENAP
jgi:DNA-binding NarL/FixJ family response regulator